MHDYYQLRWGKEQQVRHQSWVGFTSSSCFIRSFEQQIHPSEWQLASHTEQLCHSLFLQHVLTGARGTVISDKFRSLKLSKCTFTINLQHFIPTGHFLFVFLLQLLTGTSCRVRTIPSHMMRNVTVPSLSVIYNTMFCAKIPEGRFSITTILNWSTFFHSSLIQIKIFYFAMLCYDSAQYSRGLQCEWPIITLFHSLRVTLVVLLCKTISCRVLCPGQSIQIK